MKKEQLEIYTSGIEIELYELAYNQIQINNEFKIIAPFQSHCDFNLFWLYSIAPGVVVHLESVEFLNKFSNQFKRKLTIKELIKYDFLIYWNKPGDFNEFKKLILQRSVYKALHHKL